MKNYLLTLPLLVLLGGCATTQQGILDANQQTQIQRRNYQSRAFNTKDKNLVLRSVVATMQDLNFIVTKADYDMGIVTGTSFVNPSTITVSVRDFNDEQTLVRLNAQIDLKALEDPKPYQNFFNALEKSLFLEGSEIIE